MSPRVLLVDIGSAAPELPVVTPPEPRPPSSWTPNPRPSPGLAPPTGLAVASIADAAVLSWTRSTAPGAATVIESAPDNAGVPGVWREVDRTGAESYTLSLPGGPRWVRVRAELNGRTSVATNAVLAALRSSEDLEQSIADLVEEQLQQDQALANEKLKRQQEDARVALEAAQDAAAKATAAANAAKAELEAEIGVIRGQVGDILQADVHSTAKAYPAGDLVQSGNPAKLYRALQDVPTGIAITNTAYWEVLGNYASLGEAVAATAHLSAATANELESVAETVNLHDARFPAGTGKLATEARVTGVESAAADERGVLGQRIGAIEVRMPTESGALATAAALSVERGRITENDGKITAVGERVGVVEGRMPAGTGSLATEARVSSVEQAAASQNSATANRVGAMEVRLGREPENIVRLPAPRGTSDIGDWTPGLVSTTTSAWAGTRTGHVFRVSGSAYEFPSDGVWAECSPGDVFDLEFWCFLGNMSDSTGGIAVGLNQRDRNGSHAAGAPQGGAFSRITTTKADGSTWRRVVGQLVAGPNTVRIAPLMWRTGGGTGDPLASNIRISKIEPATRAHGQAIDSMSLAINQQDDFLQAVADDLEQVSLDLYDPAAGLATRASQTDYTQLKGRMDNTDGGGKSIETLAKNVNTLQSQVANLPTVYLQPNMPTGGSYVVGDMWLDSDDGNKVYIWNGSIWSESATVSGATVYAQSTAPTGNLHVGDLWFDTDDNYRLRRWNGSAWIDVTDKRLLAKADITYVNTIKTTVDENKGRLNNTGGGRSIEQLASALVSVENDLPGKVGTQAFNALDTYVKEDVQGQIQANASAISGVRLEFGHGLFSAVQTWQFARNNNGFGPINASLAWWPITQFNGATQINATSSDPQFFSPPGLAIDGSKNPVVRALVRKRAGGTWQGALYWQTDSHGISGTHVASTPAPADMVWTVLEWDLSANEDWRTSIIRRLRFDFMQSQTNVDVQWIAVGYKGAPVNAGVTETMRVQLDQVTGQLSASFSVAVNVNGYHTGVISQNTGTWSSWQFLTDTFGIYNTSGAGLSWTDGTLWNVRGTVSMISGPSLGDGMTFYLGPTPISPAQAKRSDAVFSVNADGAKVKGLLEGSLLDTGALSRNSTRIHTGNGRLAPFVIKAGGYASGGAPANRNIDVANIISPDYLSGYHFRRMAWRKSDVFLEAHVSGDGGDETLQIYVAYDGGAWELIASVTVPLGNRSAFPLLVRYTTKTTNWNVVSFNCRTTQGRTYALAFKVEVDNFNESSNAAHSNSGTNPGGDVGGTPPSAGNGGGNDGGFRPGFLVQEP